MIKKFRNEPNLTFAQTLPFLFSSGRFGGALYMFFLLLFSFQLFADEIDERNLIYLFNDRIVTTLNQDSHGFIWFGGSGGLSRFDGYTIEQYLVGEDIPYYGYINKIYQDPSSENSFLICTMEGIFRYDYSDNRCEIVNDCLKGINTSSILQTSTNEWLAATFKGLYIFDADFTLIKRLHTKSDLVNVVVEDSKGRVLIGSDGGLELLVKKDNDYHLEAVLTELKVSFIIIDKNNCIWLGLDERIHWGDLEAFLQHGQKILYSTSDRAEIAVATQLRDEIWVGTRGQGIYRYQIIPNEEPVQLEKVQLYANNLEIKNSTLSLFEDKEGSIWVGTMDGLYFYPRQTNSAFNILRQHSVNPHTLARDIIPSIYIDKKNVVWVGTAKGICKLSWDENEEHYSIERFSDERVPTDFVKRNRIQMIEDCGNNRFLISTKTHLCFFNPATGEFTNDPLLDDIYRKHGMWYVRAYHKDRDGNIWMAFNEGGVGIWLKAEQRLYPLAWKEYVPDVHRAIYRDYSGNVWVSSDSDGLYCLTIGKDLVTVTDAVLYPKEIFNNQTITALSVSKDHTIWAGTFDGLFFSSAKKNSFEIRQMPIVGSQMYVAAIVEDRFGSIWVSSLKGVYQLKKNSAPLYFEIDSYNEINKLWNIAGHGIDRNGILYFGGVNGLIYFDPSEVVPKQDDDIPLISRFFVNNEKIQFIGKDINYLNEPFKLSSNQRQISFEFSTLNYENPTHIQYAYKLEGIDKDWVYTDANRRYASYSNLSAGKYEFKIQSSDGAGNWPENTSSYSFEIAEVTWKSNWAIFLYSILFMSALYFVIHYFELRMKMKNENIFNDWRINRYINLSYSFRTPLSMIYTSLSLLTKNLSELSEKEVKDILAITNKNTRKLFGQIDRLLDFRKYELGTPQLNLQKTNVIILIKSIFDHFSVKAEDKNLTYKFSADISQLELTIDPDKIEVVVFNILDNAIQYTPEGGKVQVNCYIEHTTYTFCIEVKDTGNGVDKESIIRIQTKKDEFWKITNDTDLSRTRGFGLSMALDYTELHHGKLDIDTKKNEGSTFKVSLLLGSSHYRPEELEEINQTPERKAARIQAEFAVSSSKEVVNREDLPCLLLVDFDPDMEHIIQNYFSTIFRTEKVSYSKSIVKTLQKEHPAIIIADIPDSNAESFRICKLVSSQENFTDILLIVVSSDTGEDMEQTCYNQGVNLYLKKPLEIPYLAIRIKNLHENRKRLSAKIKQNLIVNPKEINILSDQDIFLANVMKVIEENMENESFTVEQLATTLCVSNSALYRKLNAIAGQSPNDFIRSVRLKRAAQLLEIQDYKIYEICNKVGFSSQRYFSACFKKQYQISPKAYAMQKKTERG